MLVIGIAGGVASGKSLVANQLEELGAVVLDGDGVGHAVLEKPDVREAIRQRWGSAVFDLQGNVARAKLAKIVFGPPPNGPAELAHLEQITHPRIRERLTQQVDALRRLGTAAVVLDAAVMFKAGWEDFCDKIVFVDAPRKLRLRRAADRGWDESEFDRREASQLSIKEKRERADFVVDNAGTPTETESQVESFWRTHIVG